ncbi:MAG: hypothetical protein N2Z65_06895 [Clostridiales bacterium]|nr:hypothetical protein [Clostridiales bacterium]
MKKALSIILMAALSLTLMFGMTGCGEEKVTLASQTVNGLSFNVPSDFGEFAEKQNAMVATSSNSTGSISVSVVGDAQGSTPADWDKDSYTKSAFPNCTDVTFVDFKTDASIAGSPAVFAHLTGKNSNGAAFECYSYIIYISGDDGANTCQSITFTFGKDNDSSLKSNIDSILKSIAFA